LLPAHWSRLKILLLWLLELLLLWLLELRLLWLLVLLLPGLRVHCRAATGTELCIVI